MPTILHLSSCMMQRIKYPHAGTVYYTQFAFLPFLRIEIRSTAIREDLQSATATAAAQAPIQSYMYPFAYIKLQNNGVITDTNPTT